MTFAGGSEQIYQTGSNDATLPIPPTQTGRRPQNEIETYTIQVTPPTSSDEWQHYHLFNYGAVIVDKASNFQMSSMLLSVYEVLRGIIIVLLIS